MQRFFALPRFFFVNFFHEYLFPTHAYAKLPDGKLKTQIVI